MSKKIMWGSFLAIVIIIIFAAVKLGGGNSSTGAKSGKLAVSASFYPLYFFSSEIGGDRAEVTNITPAAAEPHDYEPTAADIARIEQSALLVLLGDGLEPWGESMTKNADSSRTIVVVAGKNLADQTVEEDGENIVDPHIWLSPPLAEQMVDNILGGFAQADPANAAYYAENADALKAQLASLDADYKTGLASCEQKNIITSHAAFGYLASAYGLHQVPIAGLSPDAEPSPKQLADIAQFAKKNDVRYIFFESLVSPKLSETIAREVGAGTMVLNPIEGLAKDELATGKTYLTEMRSNLASLRTVLQCN